MGIIRKNGLNALVNRGELGYWVITRICGRLTRLFAGDTLERGLRVYDWYLGRKED